MNQEWTFVGSLSRGKAVYYGPDGGVAVEQDHTLLAEPTEEERTEILKRFPHLRAVISETAAAKQPPRSAFSTSNNQIMQAVGREFRKHFFGTEEAVHAPKGEPTLPLGDARAAGL